MIVHEGVIGNQVLLAEWHYTNVDSVLGFAVERVEKRFRHPSDNRSAYGVVVDAEVTRVVVPINGCTTPLSGKGQAGNSKAVRERVVTLGNCDDASGIASGWDDTCD